MFLIWRLWRSIVEQGAPPTFIAIRTNALCAMRAHALILGGPIPSAGRLARPPPDRVKDSRSFRAGRLGETRQPLPIVATTDTLSPMAISEPTRSPKKFVIAGLASFNLPPLFIPHLTTSVSSSLHAVTPVYRTLIMSPRYYDRTVVSSTPSPDHLPPADPQNDTALVRNSSSRSR